MAGFLDLNDNCITISDLYSKVDSAYVNDAVATVTIKDSDGVDIVTAQSMPYVAASNGVYRAIIASTVDLGPVGSIVSVHIDAVAGDGSVFHREDDTVYVKASKVNL